VRRKRNGSVFRHDTEFVQRLFPPAMQPCVTRTFTECGSNSAMKQLSGKPAILLQSLALMLVGLVAFAPSINFDFVNWDDPAYIWFNDLIRSWSPANLKGIATEVVTRNYAPITIFSFLIDHSFWGMNPAGYHATNVGLHLINGLLVYALIRQLTGSNFVAWTTAALFIVHPVQIESVVWISSRKGLICSLFMLWAALVRMKPDPQASDDARYIVLLGLALLSKAHAVVLPPIMLLYDMQVRKKSFAETMPRHLVPALLSLILLMMTMGAQNTVLGGVRQHMSLSTPHILAVDVMILWQYIGMLVWPLNLCVMYDPPTTGIWLEVLIGSLGWCAIGASIWRVRQTHPLWLWGGLSFLLLLFPMLNFFRITTLMNDRYLYLPCIIVFAMMAAMLERLLSHSMLTSTSVLRATAAARVVLSVSAVAAALLVTSQHLPVWKDSFSLWTHALSKYPDMPVLRIQMALTLHDAGRTQDALTVMQEALEECQPDELDRARMIRMAGQWSEELEMGAQGVASRNSDSDGAEQR
jgi:hypothetical protein